MVVVELRFIASTLLSIADVEVPKGRDGGGCTAGGSTAGDGAAGGAAGGTAGTSTAGGGATGGGAVAGDTTGGTTGGGCISGTKKVREGSDSDSVSVLESESNKTNIFFFMGL